MLNHSTALILVRTVQVSITWYQPLWEGTKLTLLILLVWPWNDAMLDSAATSHNAMFWSPLAVISWFSPGIQSMSNMAFRWACQSTTNKKHSGHLWHKFVSAHSICTSSVHLPVCPSIHLWHWDHVIWVSSKITSRTVSIGPILRSQQLKIINLFQRKHPQISDEIGLGMEKWLLREKKAVICPTARQSKSNYWITDCYIKSCTRYQYLLKCYYDPEWPLNQIQGFCGRPS